MVQSPYGRKLCTCAKGSFIGRDSDITEWRTSTVRCCGWLNTERSSPEAAAKRIEMFLAPLQKMSSAREAHGGLLKLCTDAFEFALVLRGRKDTYSIQIPAPRTVLVLEEATPRLSVWNPSGSEDLESEVIAFAISGALIKRPEYNPKKRIILEKEQVVFA